jgi:hypothetical protein
MPEPEDREVAGGCTDLHIKRLCILYLYNSISLLNWRRDNIKIGVKEIGDEDVNYINFGPA